MNRYQPLRIFVGIKIVPELAEQLAKLALPLEPFSVRLVPPSDLHVTLVPPWDETEVAEVIEKLRGAAQNCDGFPLILERLRYGPTRRQPRLLMAECRPTPEITQLKERLFTALGQTDEYRRPFLPHVTLARFPRNGRMIARRHPIDQDLTFTQRVESVELYRSPKGGGGGRGYEVLASLPLCGEVTASTLDMLREKTALPKT